MRNAFVEALHRVAQGDPRVLLLTGDLGFQAFEGLAEALGPRFINAGIAEQNMLSVAAGLAAGGFTPWVYSIAPFVTLRAMEQVRNDVGAHRLGVRIVGNGGGFAYGIMGRTHHALEDLAAMQLVPEMTCFVPAFAADVASAVARAQAEAGPVYLRLGRALGAPPCDAAPASPEGWRWLARGERATVVASGPVVAKVLELLPEFPENTLGILVLDRFPIAAVPGEVIAAIRHTGRLVTIEEHFATGGLGQALAARLFGVLEAPRFLSLHAGGYESGRYGSQVWHLGENGLAGKSLKARLDAFLRDEA